MGPFPSPPKAAQPPDSSAEEVVFAVPWSMRIASVILTGFAVVLVAGLVGGGLLLLLSANSKSSPSPTSLAISIAAGLITVPLVVRAARRELRHSLVLGTRGLRLRGIGSREHIAYEDIRVVNRTQPRSRGIAYIKIDLRDGGSRTIDLSLADSHECFHALRQLSESAAAIDSDGSVILPDNDELAVTRAGEVARTFRIRGVALLVGGSLAGVASIVVAVIVAIDPAARANPRVWKGVIMLPIVTVACIGSGVRALRQARNLAA